MAKWIDVGNYQDEIEGLLSDNEGLRVANETLRRKVATRDKALRLISTQLKTEENMNPITKIVAQGLKEYHPVSKPGSLSEMIQSRLQGAPAEGGQKQQRPAQQRSLLDTFVNDLDQEEPTEEQQANYDRRQALLSEFYQTRFDALVNGTSQVHGVDRYQEELDARQRAIEAERAQRKAAAEARRIW